jgi:CheY-like chemotaxis protein
MCAKILIVDDSTETVQMLTAWLQGDGYDTVAVDNGQVALSVAAQEAPDLILMDVNMPVMDGIEACRQLHANPATNTIPVILVSANNPTEARAEGLLAGASDYITKPINLPDLSERAASIIQAKGRYRANARRLLDELVHSALVTLPCDFAWLLEINSEEQVLVSRVAAAASGDNIVTQFFQQLDDDVTGYQLAWTRRATLW